MEEEGFLSCWCCKWDEEGEETRNIMRAEEAIQISGGAIYISNDGLKVLILPQHDRQRDGETPVEITLLGVSEREATTITAQLDLPLEGWQVVSKERLAAFYGLQQATKKEKHAQEGGGGEAHHSS
jgi:hypothetical protein